MLEIEKLGDACTACMACYNICSESAITMIEDQEGFLQPQIDIIKCTNCLLCEKVCPELNKDGKPIEKLIQQAYYGWHNNDYIRKNSSSGGVFTAFAEYILNKNGVVFGAVYDNIKNIVMHKSTEESDLASMRKSKYVQSYISHSFQKVKNFLKKDRYVFFVGTPCQISGLQHYLGKDNNKLITCDFICHGVPSMKLLKDDFALIEKKYKKKIIGFDFRPKIKSWSYDFFSFFLNSDKQKKINIPWSFDSYFKGFSNNCTLRTSCYNCNYSASQHKADITIADYWGYYHYDKKIFDERGLSLVITNTKKGRNLIESLDKKNIILNPLDWKYAEYIFRERNNANYGRKKRDAFFKDYIKYGYKMAIKKHGLKASFITKSKRKIFNFIKSIKNIITS